MAHHTSTCKATCAEERSDEVLEQIWETFEAAHAKDGREHDELPFAVETAEVREGLDHLIGCGLVTCTASGAVRFTPAGHEAAVRLIRRHRLAERLLVDVLDLHGEIIEEYACRFEHLVHQGLEDGICTLLGHPEVCPHGKPIPLGPCCRAAKHEVGQMVVKLVEMRPGQRGSIAYLNAQDQTRLQKLLAMGILPGAELELKRRSPTFVFQVGYSQFAVDENVASAVFVRLER
jgi:DtxR family Mn-dependent transcriptional regulator